MNRWARMLSEMPHSLQRLVARTNRISLPRGCSPEDRHARLRAALCHAATVRATYAALDADAHNALRALRARPGGISPAELEAQYGTVRSWSQLAGDPHPRSTAERLILLGWLVPRPAAPRHPPRYLLPPELRRWLPAPLRLPTVAPTTVAPPPPILRAASTVLFACAEQPIAATRCGMPRRSALRLLQRRLAPLPEDQAVPLLRFVLPLLRQLGLLADHRGHLLLSPAADRFLDLSAPERLERLRAAWIASSAPDCWLKPLLPDTAGIDWPLLRRRLCRWASALPAGQRLDQSTLFPALAAALGPLADAQTHGFRHVQRVPWQPRRARAIFDAALCGPLSWFGDVTCFEPDQLCAAPTCVRVVDPHVAGPTALAWRYGEPGQVIVPHTAPHAGVLSLLHFSTWQRVDEDATVYRLTSEHLAHAVAEGHTATELWALLEREAGTVPPAWSAGLDLAPATVQLTHAAVLLVDQPAVLDRAAQARTVRRYLLARPAPGIALIDPAHAEPFARALERRNIAPVLQPPPPLPPPAELTEGEAAALLVACAFYRRYAPAGTSLVPAAGLERRLRAALAPGLRAAVDECSPSPNLSVAGVEDRRDAIRIGASSPRLSAEEVGFAIGDDKPGAIRADSPPCAAEESGEEFLTPSASLPLLRRALAEHRALEMLYEAGGPSGRTRRIVRQLGAALGHE